MSEVSTTEALFLPSEKPITSEEEFLEYVDHVDRVAFFMGTVMTLAQVVGKPLNPNDFAKNEAVIKFIKDKGNHQEFHRAIIIETISNHQPRPLPKEIN